MDDETLIGRVVEAERPALLRVAFRMLGTLADAEDAVQEACVRWLRLTAAERAAVENPGAWLTRVVSRVCLEALVRILDVDVVLRADSDGKRSAARRPVVGADRVARFLLGLPRLQPRSVIEPVFTADGLSFLSRTDGEVDAVFSVGVSGGRVTDVWVSRNPEKLRLWT